MQDNVEPESFVCFIFLLILCNWCFKTLNQAAAVAALSSSPRCTDDLTAEVRLPSPASLTQKGNVAEPTEKPSDRQKQDGDPGETVDSKLPKPVVDTGKVNFEEPSSGMLLFFHI